MEPMINRGSNSTSYPSTDIISARAMRYRIGKNIAYFLCGVFVALALLWAVLRGLGVEVLLLIAAALLCYEFADYTDYARFRRAVSAREVQPCLRCNTSGRLGRRQCPDCRGRGFVVAPPDKGRPPIL